MAGQFWAFFGLTKRDRFFQTCHVEFAIQALAGGKKQFLGTEIREGCLRLWLHIIGLQYQTKPQHILNARKVH